MSGYYTCPDCGHMVTSAFTHVCPAHQTAVPTYEGDLNREAFANAIEKAKSEAIAAYLAAHPTLVDLDSADSVNALAEALLATVRIDAWRAAPIVAARPTTGYQSEAHTILAAWRAAVTK